jgi:hypothetical protein
MSSVTSTTLSAHRLTEDVTVVRLTETPAAQEWGEIVDGLNRHAESCELLALRGPGWFGDAYARSTTAVTVQSMRIAASKLRWTTTLRRQSKTSSRQLAPRLDIDRSRKS